MIRTLFVAAALGLAAPSFACEGKANCDKSHCKMKPQSEIDTAMAEVEAAEGTKARLSIEGMRCGACSDKIRTALLEVEGVRAAAVSHTEGYARVAFDEKTTDLDALVAAVNQLGHFEASPAEG